MKPVHCCYCGNNIKRNFLLHDQVSYYLECLTCGGLLEVRDFDIEGIASARDTSSKEENSETETTTLTRCDCGLTGADSFLHLYGEDNRLLLLLCPRCKATHSPEGVLLPDRAREVPLGKTFGDSFPSYPDSLVAEVDACAACGNDDPIAFVIERCKESEDIVLRCVCCGNNHKTLHAEVNPITSLGVVAKCDNCDNTTKELFRLNGEEDFAAPTVTCLVCDNEAVPATFEHEHVDIWCEDCGNKHPSHFDVRKNKVDQIVDVTCLQCRRVTHFDNDAHPLRDRPEVDVSARKRIHSIEELSLGDHIEFHRRPGYRHHALVTMVGKCTERVRVIHYSGEPGQNMSEADVREEWLEMTFDDPVHVVQYHPDRCFKPRETIDRARRKLGEKRYSLVTNNCEHFARWAKTGVETSLQVGECVKGTVNTALCVAKNAGITLVRRGVRAVVNSQGVYSFGVNPQIAGLVVTVKVKQMYSKISEAKQKLYSGDITRQDFKDVIAETTIKETAECAGAVGGMIVGQMLMPIPFLNEMVGATLGSILGQMAGYFVHGAYAHMK